MKPLHSADGRAPIPSVCAPAPFAKHAIQLNENNTRWLSFARFPFGCVVASVYCIILPRARTHTEILVFHSRTYTFRYAVHIYTCSVYYMNKYIQYTMLCWLCGISWARHNAECLLCAYWTRRRHGWPHDCNLKE